MSSLHLDHPDVALELAPLEPFGLLVRASSPGDVRRLSVAALRAAAARHRLLVLRGFTPFASKDALAEYCGGWGPILMWDFGAVFEVVEHASPSNYLFTSGSVPYHWDGAFAAQVPWFQFFQCLESPGAGAGGETIFCDTVKLLASLDEPTRRRWQDITVVYGTEKVAHYGGRIRAPLVGRHPVTGEATIRFAEPANESTVRLNTPQVEVEGMSAAQSDDLLAQLRRLTYDPRFVYAHAWQPGDLLAADNHALLHGRNPYRTHTPRRLWRVHVLN
jgi:alpha-ketoglutarate-dependent taurine dioxygenase